MIDDPSTDSLLLVMEHVDGGSLEQPYDPVSKTWETLPQSLVHRHFRELCKVPPTLYLPLLQHASLIPSITFPRILLWPSCNPLLSQDKCVEPIQDV